ncbi:MAG: DUF3302 domain-containing protein [Pseudolabrys sp.]
MLDVFAWIVLLILLAIALAMFFIAGSLPGHIAKSRGHPWVQAIKPSHIIRKVILRQIAIVNYVNPF